MYARVTIIVYVFIFLIYKWWIDESKDFSSPLTVLKLSGDEMKEGTNISRGGNNAIWWVGQSIIDEEVGLVDEILRNNSTLTMLDLTCVFERKVLER